MALLQGAKNKNQHKWTKDFIKDFNFLILPFSANIGHRALIYVEQYGLSVNMRSGDAIIAVTAVENNMLLNTSNSKHFKPVVDLQLKIFKP